MKLFEFLGQFVLEVSKIAWNGVQNVDLRISVRISSCRCCDNGNCDAKQEIAHS